MLQERPAASTPVKTVNRKSRKLETAVKWLQDNESMCSLSGRELEEVYSEERISYKTWNKAKKEV